MSETEHPKGEPEHPIFRTSPERTGKMMIIMVGICIVGGAIFFSMWDYWISAMPVVPGVEVVTVAPVTATGVEIPITLSFIESSDFITLAFNALPGEPGNNPTIKAEVGDKILFDVVNDGKSFHSFGVTKDTEGIGGIYPGSEVASPSNPLKPGEDGQSEFIAPEEGIFYYICTVPGHREQGMVGQILVGDVSAESTDTQMMAPEPEPEPEPEMEEPAVTVTTPKVESPPTTMAEFTGTISVPAGTAVPGCEATNECYIPYEVSISVGDTVTWSNDDTAAHTVTSGTPADGPDGTFDSSLFMAGNEYSVTFDTAGEYDYFCMVHPWMTGKIQVS